MNEQQAERLLIVLKDINFSLNTGLVVANIILALHLLIPK